MFVESDALTVRVPSSKSLTQRALVLAALAERDCRLLDPLECDDSRVLVAGLRAMGVGIEQRGEAWELRPPPALVAPAAPLELGNAGTAVRFMSGLALLVDGELVIDGNQAMRRRPMPSLLAALRALGVEVEELGRPDCPPVRLRGGPRRLTTEGQHPRVRLEARQSSQELSALLLAGAALPHGLRVEVVGELPSRPYVDLTLSVLRDFGARLQERGPSFDIEPGLPGCAEYRVEGDWSAASYPLAAGFLTGRRVAVENVSPDSLQGDRVFPDILGRLAQPGPRTIDLRDAPDLAPSVVACALFAEGETEIGGAAHLRVKESDRIGVTVRELGKAGARLEERPDGLLVRPGGELRAAELDPAHDHRLAMAFGLVSLRVPGLQVLDPGCVSKSYPGFWDMLGRFGQG